MIDPHFPYAIKCEEPSRKGARLPLRLEIQPGPPNGYHEFMKRCFSHSEKQLMAMEECDPKKSVGPNIQRKVSLLAESYEIASRKQPIKAAVPKV